MWSRACPLCFAKMPRTSILAQSGELTCPSCHASLELSQPSKVLSAAAGLLVGYALTRGFGGGDSETAIRWVLPLVGAVLTYGFVSALILFFLSDLVVRSEPPTQPFPQMHR